MQTYSIGEVSEVVGVKPHVIRYWVQEIPLLAPRRGRTGRRTYTAREVRLLLRLRRLLHEERYTLEGARERLWVEIEAPLPEAAGLLSEIRDDLLDALVRLRRLRAGAWPEPGETPRF